VLGKALVAVLRPWKWGCLARQGVAYLQNVFCYGNFSFNLNSRAYWNRQLARLGDRWRDGNYRHIIPLLPPDGHFSLLDIGCALGDGCELLRRVFPKARLHGADISEVGIAKAREKCDRVEYFVLDILTEPPPGRYDYITHVETLEHFDKCLGYVDRALIVSVPYTPRRSGKIVGVGEHRYCFNEHTFAGYHHRIVGIAEHGGEVKETVILYELWPTKIDAPAGSKAESVPDAKGP